MNQKIRDQYKVTIGIECHVQLATKTKLFSGVSNDARRAKPNSLISHIDLGLPGALPVLNEKAIMFASRAALALGTKPEKYSQFDRKHYFYPDLPMGYQITQFYYPIIKSGQVKFDVEGQEKVVHIHEAHLEADAGKSTHPEGADYSLVDLNRAGTPLLEIVSKPEMHSAIEAKAYARELWLLMRFAEISDADLYQGNMRFDVNVSVSKNKTLGTRTETKNLNSFKSVEKAVEYEVNRQIELLEKGQSVVQETRGWDEAKQKTFGQRGKEEAHDYRYMPDPDLPPVEISQKIIDDIEKTMPPNPSEYRKSFTGSGFEAQFIEDLLTDVIKSRTVLSVLHKYSQDHAKRIAFWLVQTDLESSKGNNLPDNLIIELVKVSEMVNSGQLSSTGAKKVTNKLLKSGGSAKLAAQELGVEQVSDQTELQKIIKEVLGQNEAAVTDIKNGELKAIGFLVGQVMKLSKGSANPGLTQQMIKKQLGL
ncbi:MAG: Asp-tRNA(Asn)/Glu-tRNA(Gln) amidotransferase subunit GatB [Patescibacteria group bacterium]